MQMFREYDPGMNNKVVTPFDRQYHHPQLIDVADQ
jgi:hypothetical protein